jgi:hypothetical protein
MNNTIKNNMDNELPKRRGRRPLTPEQTNIFVDKNSVVLTEEIKKEMDKRRQIHNDKNKQYYEKNKEKIIEKAKERYYNKIKENSDISSKTSDEDNSSNNSEKKRGRPKGTIGIKRRTEYSNMDNETIKKIKDMKKAINIISKIGGDATEYVNKLNELKSINKTKNETKKENKKEKKSNVKPIDKIKFIHYMDTNSKKIFSKQI